MRVCTIFFAVAFMLILASGPGSGTALGMPGTKELVTPHNAIAVPVKKPGEDPRSARGPHSHSINRDAQKGSSGDKSAKGKSADKKDKKKDEKKDEKKDGAAGEVKRPDEPSSPPDPEELKVQPDKNNKIKVNFKGQPWPAVLEWLADISNMDFVWQEAPDGFLNLTTRRSYTVDEIRDRINQRLLVRGYTLLGHDEELSLVKIEKLDPSLVPRIAPHDLAKIQPHEFVKVSFVLDHLLAEKMVEELNPMKSPNGKLIPMLATNRIEAMDAVVNLREIHALLDREQSGDERQLQPKWFKLKHRRASEVVPQLKTLLGIGSKKPSVPITAKQRQQAQQRAVKRAKKKGKAREPPKPPTEIYLLADDRNNFILAQAPPDKMAIIARAIKMIDLPLARAASLQATLGRMQIYHLSTMDPQPLVKTLNAIGNLDLDTRLEVDQANKTIIAYATLADHVTIRALVDKLDGSGREFWVRNLRHLEADYVAGTIQHMIFGGEEEQKSDRFRVDADVENNRLLLWANKVELEEVDKFLVKLGETPPGSGSPETLRVLDIYSEEEAAELIRRLRGNWRGENRLKIYTAPTKVKEPKVKEPEAKETLNKRVRQTSQPKILLAQFSPDSPADKPREENPSAKPQAATAPAIIITRNAEGRIVITSEDTDALDRLELLIEKLAPPRKDYHIFLLKHAYAYYVALTLKTFFKEESEEKEKPRRPYWYYDYGSSEKTKERARLSRRRPLRFIVETENNSILVQGADAEQLRQIKELVDFYDQSETLDEELKRKTETIPIRYSKASEIAKSVKEVYRDVLSSKDKAFAGEKKGETTRYFFDYAPSDDGNQITKAPRFKGLLSIGVDNISNTLILSAPAWLFDQVKEMIQKLDRAALSTASMKLVRIGENINPKDLEMLLKAVTAGTYTSTKPAEKKTSSQAPGASAN